MTRRELHAALDKIITPDYVNDVLVFESEETETGIVSESQARHAGHCIADYAAQEVAEIFGLAEPDLAAKFAAAFPDLVAKRLNDEPANIASDLVDAALASLEAA